LSRRSGVGVVWGLGAVVVDVDDAVGWFPVPSVDVCWASFLCVPGSVLLLLCALHLFSFSPLSSSSVDFGGENFV
jgi:hypothetical protein